MEPIARGLHVTSDMLLFDRPILEYEMCHQLNYYDLLNPNEFILKKFGNVL